MKFVLCFILLHILSVSSLLLPQEWSVVRPTLENLRETKTRLSTSLQSLISDHTYENSSIHETLTFIPRELMHPALFSNLGLSYLFEGKQQWVNLTSVDQVVVPKDFQSFFIFNSSEPVPSSNFRGPGFHKLLGRSVPFALPHWLELSDYYMVVPSSHLNLSSSSELVTLPRSKLPIFREPVTGNKPMLVFMFNQTTPRSKHTPIITIKNYLTSEGRFNSISSFFDRFANLWLTRVNYDNLVHAVYCTLTSSESYCLKIKDDQSVHVFPALHDFPRHFHSKFGDKREIETQAIRQIHDMLSVKTDRFNDISYELAHSPKTVIEKADEKLDSKFDGTITRMHDVKESVLDKLDGRKTEFIDKVGSKLDHLDDKTDLLADKIKEKAAAVSKYKLHPKIFDKEDAVEQADNEVEQADDQVEQEEDAIELPDREPEAEVQPEAIYNNDITGYVNKRNQYYEDTSIVHSDGSFSIPLSLLRLESVRAESPRSRSYSQVVNLATQQPLKRREEVSNSDCQPITWYNIFHYSIFGEPKFCNDDDTSL